MKELKLIIIVDDEHNIKTNLDCTNMRSSEIVGHLETMKFTVLTKENKKTKVKHDKIHVETCKKS